MTARLEVDLDGFAENLAEIARRTAPAAHMLVVKDDAYGHGLAPIVTRAWRAGVRWFGAFDIATGIAVRAVAPGARIFSWIVGTADEARLGAEAGLDLGVGDPLLLEDVAAAGGTARVHLKIDTGLHRNGVRMEDWPAFTARAAELERAGAIEVVGVWSHLAEASDAEDDAAHAAFQSAVRIAREAGLSPELLHLAASAASFQRPEFRYDLVRVGAFAYGIRPAGGPSEEALGIRPIAALVAPATGVSDAGAVIGVGALDGLPSTLAGIRVATPGGPRSLLRIGLDESVVEAWPDAAEGDEVVIYGAGAPLTATDIAETYDGIGEEIAVRVSPLLPRRYAGS